MLTKVKPVLYLLAAAAFALAAQPPAPSSRPKLVVAIIIDQFRYDYLTRFESEYHGGLHQLMTQGADFTNAFYQQIPTVTAVGHSIFMSGAMPAVSGIVGNTWYDRGAHKVVTSVCDWDEHIVGGAKPIMDDNCTDADPASPRRLLASTLGDELRTASPASRVIGLSLKSRAAILPAGHRAAGAFWFDDVSGNFVTSSFYMQQLPSWAQEFNGRKLPAQYVNRSWQGFPKYKFTSTAPHPYANLAGSPWGNELVERFAESALHGEQLGQRGVTDLLTISFSSNDYVGHRFGPDSPEVRDMAIRTDQLLAKLFAAIDQQVGLRNTVIVLSADHGVAPTPAVDKDEKMPGEYLQANAERMLNDDLSHIYGERKWVVPSGSETSIYLDWNVIRDSKIAPEQIFQTAESALFSHPELHLARAYSAMQLENGIAGDFIAQAAMNGFYRPRSGDLSLVFEPDVVPGSGGTSHFSPYAYDRHVPVLFMGPGIKPREYNETIAPNDIAPTLATMLRTQTPSGSSGRVLTEMLVH